MMKNFNPICLLFILLLPHCGMSPGSGAVSMPKAEDILNEVSEEAPDSNLQGPWVLEGKLTANTCPWNEVGDKSFEKIIVTSTECNFAEDSDALVFLAGADEHETGCAAGGNEVAVFMSYQFINNDSCQRSGEEALLVSLDDKGFMKGNFEGSVVFSKKCPSEISHGLENCRYMGTLTGSNAPDSDADMDALVSNTSESDSFPFSAWEREKGKIFFKW